MASGGVGAAGAGGGGRRGPVAVGRALRECREAFGRSLDDVAEATRIRRSYLEALESGDYSEFPGDFWARLFLKSYAQHLGLPPDELIGEAFAASAGAGATPPSPPAAPPAALGEGGGERAPAAVDAPAAPLSYRPRARVRQGDERTRRTAARLSELGPRAARRQWTSPAWAALAAVIVALLLAGIVYNFVHGARATGTLPATAATATGGRTGHGGGAGSGSYSRPGQGAATTGNGGGGASTRGPASGGYQTLAYDVATSTATYRARGATSRLALTFTGPCWVGVRVGASTAYAVNRTYLAGETLTLAGGETLRVTLGAAWQARGTLNGQALGPWRGGRVWNLEIEP